ncbi:glycoside hydrolase family 3 protein [Flammeovirga pacifica]|uniref:beta-N-acetylhexosaminidase n=1 Tax=Flammeovirga pacifica TaxID=915059 RepID=A0A1S1YUN3_FLAPC|nr:glycoside hydrolase family 3 N-terminal domain-containing protein [Flammeovirga pacifica]OHX64734.1 hypothetical protein NH26_24535 [Flammeovirga pacifica]
MNKTTPQFLKEASSEWVKQTFNAMSLDEKIGQLFQVAAFSNKSKEHTNEILSLIKECHLGGITFFQGTIDAQISLTNLYQKESKIPLFINMDAEWGIGMRLEDGISFPYQMTLGAIQNNALIYKYGKYLGSVCKAMGVSSPLAPVVDVNNNAQNPVINYRSFGADKYNVAEKGVALMQGLQSQKVLDNAKHFPGHGDTSSDSHLELPVLHHSDQRLREIELYPFQQLINAGASSIMSAHLQIPVWDNQKNQPSTLSSKILNGLLKDELGFEGLIITDAMDMKGITNHYENGEADALAICGGNHIITNSKDVRKGIETIKSYLSSGRLDQKVVDEAVLKILSMKKWVGLDTETTISYSAQEHHQDTEGLELLQELCDHSVTSLLGNEIAPLDAQQKNAFLKIDIQNETVSIRDEVAHHLKDVSKNNDDVLTSYFVENDCTFFHWKDSDTEEELITLLNSLSNYDRVFLGVFGINKKPLNHFDLPEVIRHSLFKNIEAKKLTYLHLGNAFALDELQFWQKSDEVLLTYQDLKELKQSVIKILNADLKPSGTLPVVLKSEF